MSWTGRKRPGNAKVTCGEAGANAAKSWHLKDPPCTADLGNLHGTLVPGSVLLGYLQLYASISRRRRSRSAGGAALFTVLIVPG